jgi:NAD-dependent dihydropyrimidine dehydrogenase PreA subunit
MVREVVVIDENLCDGCGECIPSCHEGALRLVNGKARLVSDRLCDGLGACLGHCPRGAIRMERRDAKAFDQEVIGRLAATASTLEPGARILDEHPPPAPSVNGRGTAAPSGCPGSRFAQFATPPRIPGGENEFGPTPRSELSHWPVQLGLLPAQAPVLRGARLLIAADCVPVAYPDFHRRLLRGRTVMIGCPKFDDLSAYVDKLTDVLRLNKLREVVVARMEVPCCTGLVAAALDARRRAGAATPITEVIIGTRGQLLGERPHPVPVAPSPVAPAE